jgi:hypothetical protein
MGSKFNERKDIMNNTDSPLDMILDKLHQQYEMEYGMHKKPLRNKSIEKREHE